MGKILKAKSYKLKACTGFSLIELLLVVGLIALITVFVFNTLTGFRQQSDVDAAAQDTLSTLRLARSRTLSSENASSYGVYFESATFTLFTGRAYVAGAATNDAHTVPDSLQITTINLSTTTQSVVFDRVTGQTSTTGTITLQARGNTEKARMIAIDDAGNVALSATSVAQAGTRVADSRHLHFDLGWSIENASALRLHFLDPPNPDVVNDITMMPTTTPRTMYSWEGDTDVNGQNQHLQVTAHTLNSSNTLLSIQRHGDQNNRALSLSIIDGGTQKDIVSYTASGTATVQIYGGTMTTQ